jgi:hypothetical protein
MSALTNDRLLILERFGGTESQELASEVLRLRKVVDELKFLRDTGYDGPFMGEAIEPLMLAFHAWEREQALESDDLNVREHKYGLPAELVGFRCICTEGELRALPVGTKLACLDDLNADVDRSWPIAAYFTKTQLGTWKRDDGYIASSFGLGEVLGRLYTVTKETP